MRWYSTKYNVHSFIPQRSQYLRARVAWKWIAQDIRSWGSNQSAPSTLSIVLVYTKREYISTQQSFDILGGTNASMPIFFRELALTVYSKEVIKSGWIQYLVLLLPVCLYFSVISSCIQISRSPKVGRPRNSPANTHVRRKLPLSKFDDDDQVSWYL